MSKYIIDPLTRLVANVTGLAEEKAAQWARGLVVLAFTALGVAALIIV